MTYRFPNEILKEFGQFSHKQLKVTLDKSLVYYGLAEELYFLDKVTHRISTF